MTVHLKDSAEYTGVSIKTVSNVVNGNYMCMGEKVGRAVLHTPFQLRIYQSSVYV